MAKKNTTSRKEKETIDLGQGDPFVKGVPKNIANIDLTPQEEENIKKFREQEELKKRCAAEIDAVLTKYNTVLTIDPYSPFGAPVIVVSLR
tara:strand:+ start:8310 stop:8582 length:273 start_codon:yes stop_codon:yes gene_type:complete